MEKLFLLTLFFFLRENIPSRPSGTHERPSSQPRMNYDTAEHAGMHPFNPFGPFNPAFATNFGGVNIAGGFGLGLGMFPGFVAHMDNDMDRFNNQNSLFPFLE